MIVGLLLAVRLDLGAAALAAIVVVGFFGRGCLLVYAKQTETTDPGAYEVLPDDAFVSPEADAWGMAEATGLQALGFTPRRRIRWLNPGAPTTGFGQRFDHGRTGDVATLIHLSRQTDAGVRTTRVVVFAIRFAGGGCLFTTNSPFPSLTPPIPGWSSHRFPELVDAARLYQVHRRLVERSAARRPIALTFGDDPLAWELEQTAASRQARLAHGLVVADQEARLLRLTLKGAVRATWMLGPPMFQIRERWTRRRSRALLREIGVAA